MRAAHGYDYKQVSDENSLFCEDPSLAQQSSKDECDINIIVRRFGITGELPENVVAPQYADFHQVYDYQSAMQQIKAAEAAFMELPAHIRYRFQNDPQQFVDFCSDDNNRPEAESLGLVFAKPIASLQGASLNGAGLTASPNNPALDAGPSSSTPVDKK